MELEYVFRAVRRHWLTVIASVVLGILAAYLLTPSPTPRYESNALMLMTPPDAGFGGTAGDRFISSQIVVLEAPAMAAEASRRADLGLAPAEIADAVRFIQVSGTDVVRISAEWGTPDGAQTIANAYLDAYIETTETALGAGESSDAASLANSLAEIEQQLADINAQIETVMAPFADPEPDDFERVQLEDVAPELAAARDVTLDKYREFLLRRASLEFEPQGVPVDRVIQRAALPTAPTPESSRLIAVGIALAFALFGVVLATVLARASRRVLDAREVTETLGVPFAADVPDVFGISARSLDHVTRLPDEMRDVVNSLCVLAEAKGTAGRTLTVLVTGSQRSAGTTTLAAAMAARFGARGSRVALLDFDFEHLDLSTYFDVHGDGFSLLLSIGQPFVESRLRGAQPPSDGMLKSALDVTARQRSASTEEAAFTPTTMPNVSVVGRRQTSGTAGPQRMDYLVVLDVASTFADVVVIDAGPLLAESAGAVMAPHTDAVVLAVPVRVQKRAPLRTVARHLNSLGSAVLPVATPAFRVPVPRPTPPSSRPAAVGEATERSRAAT